jgi:HK97 family phage major capsid protein
MVDLNYQNTINLDEGGYLTSEGYSATILKLVQSQSVVEPFLTVYPMNHKVENVNTIASNASAYFVAQEAAVKQKSAFKFGTFKMELQEIATIIPFTEDWVKFANVQTAALLQEAIVNAITKLIDQSMLGYVTNPWLNTISGSIPAGNIISTGADLLIKLSNAMGKVEEGDYIPNGFIAPISAKASLRNLRDLDGQPIFQPANATEPATLYGQPIRFSSNMIASGSPAAKEIIVGDFKQAYKGNDAAIEFKMLDQATINVGGTLINLAEQDMVAIRAKVWKAFNVLRVDAFAKVLL